MFQANGFDVKEAEDGQLLLAAVPYSKDTVFGMQDAQELLHLLISRHSAPFQMSSQVAGDTSKVVRPSRSGPLLLLLLLLLLPLLRSEQSQLNACALDQGPRDAGQPGLSLLGHDWEGAHNGSDACHLGPPVQPGVALELPTRQADAASPCVSS